MDFNDPEDIDDLLKLTFYVTKFLIRLIMIICGAILIQNTRKISKEQRSNSDNTEFLIGIFLVVTGLTAFTK